MRDPQLGDSISCCFCNPSGSVQIGIGEDQGELFAALSRRHVAWAAAARPQCGRHLLQTLIARLMTVVIVVRFEEINIAQHKRQTPFVATRGPYLGGEIGIEETPVGKTCKSVVQGQLFEGTVATLRFCGQLSKPGVVHSGFNQQHDGKELAAGSQYIRPPYQPTSKRLALKPADSAMSKSHAHMTTISHRSSTLCGPRRHRMTSARSSTANAQTTKYSAGVKRRPARAQGAASRPEWPPP